MGQLSGYINCENTAKLVSRDNAGALLISCSLFLLVIIVANKHVNHQEQIKLITSLYMKVFMESVD